MKARQLHLQEVTSGSIHNLVHTLVTKDEGDECRLLDGVVELAANDGPHPWACGVEGYYQVDLPYVQTTGRRQATMVEMVVSVVAEVTECVVQHSREPWVVLAHGNKPPILGEGEVRVVLHAHLKTQP
jgi:hypothetical protein